MLLLPPKMPAAYLFEDRLPGGLGFGFGFGLCFGRRFLGAEGGA